MFHMDESFPSHNFIVDNPYTSSAVVYFIKTMKTDGPIKLANRSYQY